MQYYLNASHPLSSKIVWDTCQYRFQILQVLLCLNWEELQIKRGATPRRCFLLSIFKGSTLLSDATNKKKKQKKKQPVVKELAMCSHWHFWCVRYSSVHRTNMQLWFLLAGTWVAQHFQVLHLNSKKNSNPQVCILLNAFKVTEQRTTLETTRAQPLTL